MASGYTEDGKTNKNFSGKNAEKGDRKTGSASKNNDEIFETNKITDWIKTKPSSVLTRVREREERASENRKGTIGFSSLASKFCSPFRLR
mmetsp:Transcript_2875/g.5980  ORF Transcript_2875/g.5980 Transcript_2875/m.5980 type:complete len:90 (-) Transcript_2875:2729-2998(-)